MSLSGPNIGRVQADFKNLTFHKLKELSREVGAFAQDTANDAKRLAPVGADTLLRKSISAKKVSEYQYEIAAQTKYAAYVEFGTRSKVSIPPGAEEIAKEAFAFAKSNKGSIAEFKKSLTRWVEKKGIAGLYSVKTRKLSKSKDSKALVEQAVFAIMMKILRVGIEPQPYFFPAIQQNTIKLDKRLRQIIAE